MINEEFQNHVARLFVKPQDHIGRTLHAAVGIAGEAGEVLDAVKKTWIYGKPLDTENLLEESGDLLFYISALLTENGFTLEQAMRHNMEKLAKRYPLGYTDLAALQRADKEHQDKVNLIREEYERGREYWKKEGFGGFMSNRT